MSGVKNQLTHNVSNITMYVSSPELKATGISLVNARDRTADHDGHPDQRA
jgi:hypothetical protein